MKAYREAQRARRLVENGPIGQDWDGGFVPLEQDQTYTLAQQLGKQMALTRDRLAYNVLTSSGPRLRLRG